MSSRAITGGSPCCFRSLVAPAGVLLIASFHLIISPERRERPTWTRSRRGGRESDGSRYCVEGRAFSRSACRVGSIQARGVEGRKGGQRRRPLDCGADRWMTGRCPPKVRQCLINLLSNAAKFTEKGRILRGSTEAVMTASSAGVPQTPV